MSLFAEQTKIKTLIKSIKLKTAILQIHLH